MNVLIFSMTPIFPDFAMGGAQIQLKKVAKHLGTLGHDIKILCTRRDAEHQGFFWLPNVEIIPIFRFKQPYPEPYLTPVYHIANAIQDMADYLTWADVHFSNDGGLIFPYVYQNLPTVISLRSIIFAETLQSAYLFDGDWLIVPSQYMKDCLIASVGRHFPELSAKIKVIHNGFDFDIFQPKQPDQIGAYLPDLDTKNHQYILFPHRPEASKGFLDCVDVVEKLVYQYGLEHVRVLVPRWIESAQSPEDRKFYQSLEQHLRQRGLNDYFIFHDWIPESLLPEYYSLGSLTLVIGAYIETFGNVSFESLLCETPVILSRVAPNRSLIPESFIYKADYGDIEAISHLAHQILTKRERVPVETLTFIKQNFPLEKMVNTFADVITHAQRTPNITYQPTLSAEQSLFSLAPWCYSTSKGIFHDFNATYYQHPLLEHIIDECGIRFDLETLLQYGVTREQIEEWMRDGYIYPINPATDHIAYIMAGSNTQAILHLCRAVKKLKAHCQVERVSSIYESPDNHGVSDHFFNMAIQIRTHYSADELKQHILRKIEDELGRDRTTKHIVTIDLDISLFDQAIIPEQKIPDPAILKYHAFLLPLVEIAPDYQHPIHAQPLKALLANTSPQPSVKKYDWS